jgi:excisionase family DNA binding protein
MRKYSTTEVAKMLGLHQPNLQRAIRQRRITAPPIVKVGRMRIRLWSKTDVEVARRELSKRKG